VNPICHTIPEEESPAKITRSPFAAETIDVVNVGNPLTDINTDMRIKSGKESQGSRKAIILK